MDRWLHPYSKQCHIIEYVIIKQRYKSDSLITHVMRDANVRSQFRLPGIGKKLVKLTIIERLPTILML